MPQIYDMGPTHLRKSLRKFIAKYLQLLASGINASIKGII